MQRDRYLVFGTCAVAVATLLSSCRRESRQIGTSGPARERAAVIRTSALQPGPTMLPSLSVTSSAEGNAYGISEGQRLFGWYNCAGCHSHGGGGIGPALMDSVWIYGSDPGQIYQTIQQGRPNGMPSFAGRITDHQLWQIVAYVRSLSGLEPTAATSPRAEHLKKNRVTTP